MQLHLLLLYEHPAPVCGVVVVGHGHNRARWYLGFLVAFFVLDRIKYNIRTTLARLVAMSRLLQVCGNQAGMVLGCVCNVWDLGVFEGFSVLQAAAGCSAIHVHTTVFLWRISVAELVFPSPSAMGLDASIRCVIIICAALLIFLCVRTH